MVTKVRTVKLGAGTASISRTVLQIEADNVEALYAKLQSVAASQVAEQVQLGNEPDKVEVDGSSFKQLSSAKRNVTVYFGQATFAKKAMLEVERMLAIAIDQSTEAHTGALRNIQANWQWTLVRGFSSDKRKPGGPVTPSSVEAMGVGFTDMLILKPKLFYATAVNANVAGGRKGALNIKSRGKYGKKGTANYQSKRWENIGFFRFAAESLRRIPLIKQSFNVSARFTNTFLAPGEVSTEGKGGKLHTGMIVLRPRRKGRLS